MNKPVVKQKKHFLKAIMDDCGVTLEVNGHLYSFVTYQSETIWER